MKLRNKKTGEIREIPDGFFLCDNLKKICEEWEDYEKPKGIQCIYYVNHFDAAKLDGVIVGFATKEESKKAVEKLKAWKRLKDKGFRFTGWNGTMVGKGIKYKAGKYYEKWVDDMNLLFGDEE